MKRYVSAVAVCVVASVIMSCGSQSTSNPGANVTGNWNALLTENGQATPSYSFGMAFSKDTTVITGSEIAYTGPLVYNTGCVNYTGLTASGNTNGGSVITLVVTDPSTNSRFTISGTADSTVTQINGTFSATFGPNGSKAACPQTSGTVVFTRQ